MNKQDITAVILTFNEEIHIQRCIDSIKDIVADIVIIDSFSSDQTVSLCEKLGARVFQNPWTNHATQFNWGLDNTNIGTEWVLRMDADEYLESGHDELQKLESLADDVSGIYIKRKYYFMGAWIKHGTMYPITHLRLWRTKAGRVEDRWMDERTVLNYGNAVELDIDIVDDNKNSLSWWTNKHNSYATCEVVDNLNTKYRFMKSDNAIMQSGGRQAMFRRYIKENIYLKLPLFVRPVLYFCYRYFIRFGFLDGMRGFIFHFMQAFWYRMLVDAKTYEAKLWLNNETNPHKVKKILKHKTGLDI